MNFEKFSELNHFIYMYSIEVFWLKYTQVILYHQFLRKIMGAIAAIAVFI